MQGRSQRITVESGRKNYPVSGDFVDLGNLEVYARVDDTTAYLDPITNTNYTIAGGEITFNVDYDLDTWEGIKIFEPRALSTLQVEFLSMGDISPDNLNANFEKIFDNLKVLEEESLKRMQFDADTPGNQVHWPLLKEGAFYTLVDGKITITDTTGIFNFNSVNKEITQATHGFTVDKAVPLFFNGTTFELADISGANDKPCDYIGVASTVDKFNLYSNGFISIPAGDTFTDGENYYLSQATPGVFTNTKPTTGKIQACFKVLLIGGKQYIGVNVAPPINLI